MTKYAALPLIALLAACAAEVENGTAAEANVDDLFVENLIITDAEVAGATGTEAKPDTQAAPAAAPEAPAARSAPVQSREPAAPKTAPASEPKAPAKTAQPKAPPPAESKVGPAPTDGSCPPEHREMGHC